MQILAMTKSQKDLEAWIEDQTIPVMETLAQLYLFKGSQYTNHWRQEVWAKFYRIPKTKNKKRGPSKEFILNSSWGIDKDETDGCYDFAIDKEFTLTPGAACSYSEFAEIVYNYFDWLSQQLSKFGRVHAEDVYEKLESLGL